MLRTIGIPFTCLAMFYVAGGHWAVLQTIAWTQMLRDYSKNASLTLAIRKTFSGEYPCSLCKQVEEGFRKQEKPQATVKVDKQAEKFPVRGRVLLAVPTAAEFSYPEPAGEIFIVRRIAPPQPVPRQLAA